MKATAWFLPLVLTLLCATRLVCTAQQAGRGSSLGGSSGAENGYPMDYVDAQLMQADYLLAKRNKPSLSIVNPLDVLRQRLLLEIARRQMKENTRQVELNRDLLKTVGKRMLLGSAAAMATATRHFQQQRQQQQQQQQLAQAALQEQQRQQQLMQQHFPSEVWSFDMPAPTAAQSPRFYDFLPQQRPQSEPEPAAGYQQLLNDAKKSPKQQQSQSQSHGIEMHQEHGKQTTGKTATGALGIAADLDSDWTSVEQNEAWNNELDNGIERYLYGLHKNKHYAN